MTTIEAPFTTSGGSKEGNVPLAPYRPPDFAVVMRVRHRFGDGPAGDSEVNVDAAAPFVGPAGEFAFSCPYVDPTQEALLQFEHRGSDQSLTFPDPQPDGGLQGITAEHPVKINGHELFGGIPATPRRRGMPLWSTRLLIIQPGVLKETNLLRIESTKDGFGHFDDFTVDNIVVFFKTRDPGAPVAGSGYHVINARQWGSDTAGDGTGEHPYRTFQRAVRDVPAVLPPGTRWIVDITGLGPEVLPSGYVLPSWKCPDLYEIVTSRFWVGQAGVNIQATPQRVAGVANHHELVVKETDIVSTTADPVTGLMTITVNADRASWALNKLKGKLVIGKYGGMENCVIWESGIRFIRVTTTSVGMDPPVAPNTAVPPTLPFEIMEPSAHLIGASLGTFRGVLNVINADSVAFNGIKITKRSPDDEGAGLFAQGYGEVITQLCELDSPYIATLGTFFNRILRCWIHGDPLFWGRFVVNQGLMDGCTANPLRGPGVPQFRRTVFDACVTLEVADQLIQVTMPPPQAPGELPTTVSYFRMDNCLIRNVPGATGDGLRWHGAKGVLNRVDIYACGRDGIRCELGTGILELQNVRTSGIANGGTGLLVADGMWVKVNVATSAPAAGGNKPLSGATDMTVGTTTRTWADFVSGASGRPITNEWDISAAAPTGATGSGSRVYR